MWARVLGLHICFSAPDTYMNYSKIKWEEYLPCTKSTIWFYIYEWSLRLVYWIGKTILRFTFYIYGQEVKYKFWPIASQEENKLHDKGMKRV